jgi:hypothetical protein
MEGPNCSFFSDIKIFLTAMAKEFSNVKSNRVSLKTINYNVQTKKKSSK